MRKLTIIKAGICLLLFTRICFASPGHWWDGGPVFLPKNVIDAKTAAPPPPLLNSKQDDVDLKELLDFQRSRTAGECARAQSEVSVSLDAFFGPKYGPLTGEEVRAWTPFFEEVKMDANYFCHQVKHLWKRPRPYLVHSDVHPCIPLESTDSYPSGHATIARVYAHVLSMLDTKRSKAFEQRANQIATDRVLGGVHNPSDIEAGQKIGDEVFSVLKTNFKFQNRLKEFSKP